MPEIVFGAHYLFTQPVQNKDKILMNRHSLEVSFLHVIFDEWLNEANLSQSAAS
jgi:hypothetical protein